MDSVPDSGAVTAARFLRSLWPDGLPPSLWLLTWELSTKRSRWWQDLDAAAAWATGRADVYVGCGLSDRARSASERCPSSEIAAIPGVWADVDYAGPAHRKTGLPPDEAAALSLLQEPRPTLVVHSGHGLQAWWLFREPWVLETGEERERAATLCSAWSTTVRAWGRARGWEVDATGDLARVLRLPGTANGKA